jgi:hypothetical protein
MSKPYIHAQSSAKRFGGIPEDYLDLHCFLDNSKSAIADNRHRALTHNSWFIMNVMPRIFGETFKRKSDGAVISVRDIAEQHVLEDFRGRFIPTAQDYLQEMDFQDWMQNGQGLPPSAKKLDKKPHVKKKELLLDSISPTFDGSNVNHGEFIMPTLPTPPPELPEKFPRRISDRLVD